MGDTKERKIQKFKETMKLMLSNAPLEIETDLTENMKNIEDLPLSKITEDVLIEQFLDMGHFLDVDTMQGRIYWYACM